MTTDLLSSFFGMIRDEHSLSVTAPGASKASINFCRNLAFLWLKSHNDRSVFLGAVRKLVKKKKKKKSKT